MPFSIPPHLARPLLDATRNLNRADRQKLAEVVQRICQFAYIEGFDNAASAAKQAVSYLVPDRKATDVEEKPQARESRGRREPPHGNRFA